MPIGVKYVWLLLLLMAGAAHAQRFAAYGNATEKTMYSRHLNDTVVAEVLLPNNMDLSGNTRYPLLFLLDSQNPANYTYSLHSIDYLTRLNAMPPCVLVGVALPGKRRTQWTTPGAYGGRAEAFMDYLTQELAFTLGQQYPLADFNLLLGHSRTAIFAMYALARHPGFFDGTIASGAAYFDFGDTLQQHAFERFLVDIARRPQNYHLVFSAGEEAMGDAHGPSVVQLEAYFQQQALPPNFKWVCYREKADHYTMPGLTVNRGLAYIFADYGAILPACFAILNDSTHAATVPWDKYLAVYARASEKYGFPIRPGLWFYNSIASGYSNDYKGFFGARANLLALEVLTQAVTDFPSDADLQAWLGELYLQAGKHRAANIHLQKALDLLAGKTDPDSQELSAGIRELLQTIK